LTKLEFLEIAGLPEVTNYLSLKEIKCINKGLNNFLKAKGSLKGISFSNFHATGS
jgi:hypothetical protein